MADHYIGQIMLFAGTFPPSGFKFCDGSVMPISNYAALYSVLGTTYGGDGVRTFNLPDLRGRVSVHAGASAGIGLPKVSLGQSWGTNTQKLTTGQLPAHTHAAYASSKARPSVQASTSPADTNDPSGNYLAAANAVSDGGEVNSYVSNPGTTVDLGGVSGGEAGGVTIDPAGHSEPFDIVQPSLGLNYCIAVTGIYPPRE